MFTRGSFSSPVDHLESSSSSIPLSIPLSSKKIGYTSNTNIIPIAMKTVIINSIVMEKSPDHHRTNRVNKTPSRSTHSPSTPCDPGPFARPDDWLESHEHGSLWSMATRTIHPTIWHIYIYIILYTSIYIYIEFRNYIIAIIYYIHLYIYI